MVNKAGFTAPMNIYSNKIDLSTYDDLPTTGNLRLLHYASDNRRWNDTRGRSGGLVVPRRCNLS